MKKVFHYTPRCRELWENYVASSPRSTVAHRLRWREVVERSFGHRSIYLMVMDDGKVTGILPLFLMRHWIWSKYVISIPWIDYGGICAEDEESGRLLLAEAIRITRRERAAFLELRALREDTFDLRKDQEKVTFVLSLHRDPDVLWKAFNAKLRNQIRKAQKSGLTAEIYGEEKLRVFYRIFAENMRDLGTPVWGYALFSNIFKHFPNSTRLVLVKKGGKTVGGGLILYFKDTVYIPSASSLRSYFSYCPNHIMYWEVIRRSCLEGYEFFDFGRSTRNSGTFRFKKQWVPVPKQLHWQYFLNTIDELPNLNPGNPKYRWGINLWRKMPLSVANFLGPKMIRNMP